MSRTDDQVHLRLPAELLAALRALAEFNRRSLTAEITTALQSYPALQIESLQPVERVAQPSRATIAAMAMQGILACDRHQMPDAAFAAEDAVKAADALLAELAKAQQP